MFDYCVHSGSENVVRWGKDNLYVVKSLREFQHIDDDGVDQGANSIFPLPKPICLAGRYLTFV